MNNKCHRMHLISVSLLFEVLKFEQKQYFLPMIARALHVPVVLWIFWSRVLNKQALELGMARQCGWRADYAWSSNLLRGDFGVKLRWKITKCHKFINIEIANHGNDQSQQRKVRKRGKNSSGFGVVGLLL